jgi:uncharacterized protein DUF6941
MEVDFVILSDAAQVQGDKMYVLGGGWSYIFTQRVPTVHQMSVTVGLLVDWMETNRRHDFKVEIRHEDTGVVPVVIQGQFEQGRPPGIPPGIQQRVMLTFNVQLPIEAVGQYAVGLQLNGKVAKKQPFMVMQGRPGLLAPT